MKAASISRYGSDAVGIVEVPEPTVTPGHVLVEVHSAGVNPFDWKIRDGLAHSWAPITFPATLGGDFSGIVKEIGQGVTGYRKGDAVYGTAIVLSGGSGSFAEYALVDAKHMATKPKKLGHKEAGALVLVGVSALQALYEHIKLGKGQKVLIHGGAGGIGSVAIQMAKHIGAHVATTAGSKDISFVTALGADEAIDYKSQQFETILDGFDAVYDTVGGETYSKSFKVLKKGGVIVSMLMQPDAKLMEQYGVKALYQGTGIDSERLAKLAKLADEGVVKVHIDKAFPLAAAAEALNYVKEMHPTGKVVIEVKKG